MFPHPLSFPFIIFINSSMVPVIVFSLLVFILKKKLKLPTFSNTSYKNPLHLTLLLFLRSFKNQPSLVKIPHWNPKISHMVLGSKSTQDSASKYGKMKEESDEQVKERDCKR